MKATLLVVFLAAVGLVRLAAADAPVATDQSNALAAALTELPAASYSRKAELIKGLAEARQPGRSSRQSKP